MKDARSVIIVVILLIGSVPAALYGLNLLDSHSVNSAIPSTIKQPGFNGIARLGIDCGYGSNEAVTNATGFPSPDNALASGDAGNPTLDPSCTWSGVPDMGTALLPLVSDNPTGTLGPSCCASPSRGGGFTAEIVLIQNSTALTGGTAVSSFDVTVGWNPKILNAAEFDQGGLAWFGANSNTATDIIDNNLGIAELSQFLLSPPAPQAALNGNVTLFKIRFDVVGIGTSPLTISNDQIIEAHSTPPVLHHITYQGSFTSRNIPDLVAGTPLGYTVNWTFTPNPEVPGSSLTLTGQAHCGACTTPLIFSWDTDSVQGYPGTGRGSFIETIEATGQSVSITAPTSLLLAHRVTLIVNDTAGQVAEATRLLPLTLTSPTSQSVGINTAASLTAKWLGGIAPYSGTTGQVGVKWILCNSTGSSQTICSNPSPSEGSAGSSTNPPLNNQSITITNSYKWAGVFTGTVQVTDTQEPQLPGPNSLPASFQVNVTGAPRAYTVSISSNATSGATTPQMISFNATIAYAASYYAPARSSTFSYIFQFGDGQSAIYNGGTVGKATHKYAAVGNYNVVVIAHETGSNALAKIQETGFSTMAVYSPLTGTLAFTPGSQMSGAFTFNGTGSGGQSPYAFSWDFGDGATGTGSSVTHTYSASGTYVVTLTVTDAGGRTFKATQTVTATVSSNSSLLYEEVGGGVAAAVILAITALMLLRRRRKTASPTGIGSAAR